MNDHYTRDYNPPTGTRVSSSDLINEFQAVQGGFDSVQAELGNTLHQASGAPMAALPNAVSRALKVLSFDADGNPRANISEVDFVTLAETAAESAARFYAFDDRYLGSKASDPTLDNDGAALLTGALYWNTTSNSIRVYGGSAWSELTQGSSSQTQSFSGNGSTTAFSLSASPGAAASLEVFISGVRQVPAMHYTLSGTTLTFITAPPSGTNNIFARWITAHPATVPSDGTVTRSKLERSALADDVQLVSLDVSNMDAAVYKTYILTASTALALPTVIPPVAGDWVIVVNMTGTTTPTVTGGPVGTGLPAQKPIMGLAQPITLDRAAPVRFVFVNDTLGWVIV